MKLLDRLKSSGPKRILSLDGGGIRGAVTLGFLERLESLLRERHGSDDLRLCDYFDLIGGTSTGSIIASGLAIGMEASEIKRQYLELGGRVFASKMLKMWQARFKSAPLAAELRAFFGDITLGDEAIKTGLCIVTKRADTGSTWPLINHPEGKFFEENRGILLRRAVLASAAAPVFFRPIRIDLGGGQIGTFIDGGVSMANNPALRLFLVATLMGFPFGWPTGEDRLMVVSVGTGRWDQREDPGRLAASKVWDWARRVPAMLMSDALWQNQLLLQLLSRTPTPWHIDAEVGDLSDDLLVREPALWYVRYDAPLEEDGLEELGLGRLAPRAIALRDMSDPHNRFDLAEIGETAAGRQVHEDHLPPTFDLSPADRG
jgi:predicted acylesterase/phospholipase RssA